MARLFGFGFGLCSLAAALAVSGPAFAAPRVPTHVACVGDSITYGYPNSSPATKGYPASLQTLFGAGVQVKNFGRNSATMLSAPYGDLPYEDQSEYTAATNFVSGAGANAVVDVIILLGANDSKSYNWAPGGKPKNDQQYLKDYRAMVEHFSALPTKPLVYLALPLATGNNPCCTIDGKVIHDEEIPLIKQLAAEKNLPTIDLNTPTTGHPEYFGDGVHPTDAGYQVVASLVHDALLVDLGSSAGGGGSGGSGGTAGAGGAPSANAGAANGGGGAGNSAGSSADAGRAGASAAGGAGSPAVAGSAGVAGSSGLAGAAQASAGAAQAGAASGGLSGASASGGAKASASPSSDSAGCALSTRPRGAFWPALLGLLGLALRRRPRRRAAV